MINLNKMELNAILYYADFNSLRERGYPLTDTCKYFFIYGSPVNSAYVVDLEPIYDQNDEYFQSSLQEYLILKEQFGEDGVKSFIDNICSIGVVGRVGAVDMLKCIHRYGTRNEKNKALNKYREWENNLKYQHVARGENGKQIWKDCSKYIAHHDKAKGLRVKSSILGGCEKDGADVETNS